ncbi:mavicyanin-like [Melia azedarach]|uniref:Mavicyanin-like n=1 Tax=Melia azedarach TaxID=155640 RepID=A0ACC1YZZ9_MELAZ|nr:mavicyanin-like [Melia azedarach]
MALAKITVAFLLMTTLVGVSLGAVHKVGDSAGWTIMGNIDYNKWASSKDFHVGDTIVFEYNNQFHNVKQVTLQDFQSCNGASPIAAYITGSDSVTLERPGHYYFLCGYPGHCEAGQKLDIMVTPPSLRPSSASPRPDAPCASSPTTAASSSQTSPDNLDDQSNASSPLQILSFNLWPALISLAQVTLRDFQSCNTASPITTYTAGSDTLILKTTGHYYFLCGYPGHCEAGQKLEIMVTPPSLRPSSARPRPAVPYASSSTATAPSSETPPNNPDVQSNACSSLQIQSFKLWPASINLAVLFVSGFAY